MDLIRALDIDATPAEIITCWKTSEELSHWLEPESAVEFRIGGCFEISFDGTPLKSHHAVDCRIISIQDEEWIDFEWKGPVEFSEIMGQGPFTWVRVEFSPMEKGTRLTLRHRGWEHGPLWERARAWHETAWTEYLSKLKRYVEGKQQKEPRNNPSTGP